MRLLARRRGRRDQPWPLPSFSPAACRRGIGAEGLPRDWPRGRGRSSSTPGPAKPPGLWAWCRQGRSQTDPLGPLGRSEHLRRMAAAPATRRPTSAMNTSNRLRPIRRADSWSFPERVASPSGSSARTAPASRYGHVLIARLPRHRLVQLVEPTRRPSSSPAPAGGASRLSRSASSNRADLAPWRSLATSRTCAPAAAADRGCIASSPSEPRPQKIDHVVDRRAADLIVRLTRPGSGSSPSSGRSGSARSPLSFLR